MPLAVGARIAHHDVTALIGAKRHQDRMMSTRRYVAGLTEAAVAMAVHVTLSHGNQTGSD